MNIETIRSSFDQKIRSGMFKPITRRLHADMAEDRAQEGLALTYEIYRQHALQGDVLDNALLVFSARVRAEDLGRNVVRCNGRARKFCVMDERNYHEGKVEMLRLSGILADQQNEENVLRLAEVLAANPVRKIVSAIDLQAWLAELSAEDRQLLSMRMAGCGWNEIGNELAISGSTAWARCRRLGYELAERAQLEIPVVRRQVRN